MSDGGTAARPTPLALPIRNAESVIRSRIHPGAKRCYQQGLGSNPQAGKLVILLRIAPNGDVDSATVSSNRGLSEEVAMCITTVARGAKFDAPGPSGSQISVPFDFRMQLSDGGMVSTPPSSSI
jgi:hypothetical protein